MLYTVLCRECHLDATRTATYDGEVKIMFGSYYSVREQGPLIQEAINRFDRYAVTIGTRDM